MKRKSFLSVSHSLNIHWTKVLNDQYKGSLEYSTRNERTEHCWTMNNEQSAWTIFNSQARVVQGMTLARHGVNDSALQRTKSKTVINKKIETSTRLILD